MLIGLPASGKTTLAGKIVRRYPAANWAILSTDTYIEMEAARLGLSYNAAFPDAINAATQDMKAVRATALSTRRNIVHDQTNLTTKSRARKLADIPSDYVKVGLLCDVSQLERQNRLASRPGKAIPTDVDAKMRYYGANAKLFGVLFPFRIPIFIANLPCRPRFRGT